MSTAGNLTPPSTA